MVLSGQSKLERTIVGDSTINMPWAAESVDAIAGVTGRGPSKRADLAGYTGMATFRGSQMQ